VCDAADITALREQQAGFLEGFAHSRDGD
jgi:hypothetical protein